MARLFDTSDEDLKERSGARSGWGDDVARRRVTWMVMRKKKMKDNGNGGGDIVVFGRVEAARWGEVK